MRKKNQEGNVLFIILAGIALFGILTVTISATMSGDVDMDDDRARMRVSHILEQETIIRSSYQMLRLANNCNLNQINLSYTADPAYNANAPTNGRCSLYHRAGGGLRPLKPIENVQNSLNNSYEEFWIESAGIQIEGVETTAPELVMLLFNVNEKVCEFLNLSTVGLQQIYTLSGSAVIAPRAYNGTFSTENVINSSDAAALVGERSFCVREGGGDNRHIYISVLEAR